MRRRPVAPPTGKEDRQLETSGMADLAAATRGTLFNVIGTGDSVFERIASQTSAFYLLGVEEAAGDRDGKRHRIDVEVRRRGVTLHSRRAFVLSSAAAARRTPEDNLARRAALAVCRGGAAAARDHVRHAGFRTAARCG